MGLNTFSEAITVTFSGVIILKVLNFRKVVFRVSITLKGQALKGESLRRQSENGTVISVKLKTRY